MQIELTETANPVPYEWWISGPDGAHFILYRKKHHSDEDINQAKAWLRRQRDVVSIKIERQ